MKTCKNCIFWQSPIEKDFELTHKFGGCKSKKWNIHPNYYTESDRKTKEDMVTVTYRPMMGQDFGCIHFEKKP